MVAKHVNKKTRKHVKDCCSCCHPPPPPPQCCGFLLLPLIMMQSHRQSEFFVNLMYHESRPRLGGLPHLKTFTWQNLTPAERIYPVWQTGLPALAGQPTYRVNVIKWIWEITWTGGLPHLSGLPHLLGVPHLHVNRPLVKNMPDVSTLLLCRFWSRYLFSWWTVGPRVLQKT